MEKEVIMVFIVAGVILKKEGKYLLVQEKQPKAYKLWNFPAGRVDVGDTIEETAIREAKEESGFDVRLIRKVGIFQKKANEPPKHIFEARIIRGELKFPEDEIMDAQWFSYGEIKGMKDKLRNEWILEAIDILEKEKTMKVILVDAVDTFVIEGEGIFREMYNLLETFPNRKIILTNANDEQMNEFGLVSMPYEIFTLKHNPDKDDPKYFETMLDYFDLDKDNVIYFEHNPEAVKSAESIGIKSYYYNPIKKDLELLKEFLENYRN